MSLFVAVRPSLEVVEHLDDRLQRVQLLPQARELRWQPAALWHITLAFLGDPAPAAEPEAVEALDDALSSTPAIDGLRLTGCGTFDRQVLWLGLEDAAPMEPVRQLVAAMTRSLREAGLRPDRRPWRPHLTIARSRSRQANVILDALADYRSPRWSIDEVLLIRSSGGPRPEHRVLNRSPLGGARSYGADGAADADASSQGGAGASIRASDEATPPKRSSPSVH